MAPATRALPRATRPTTSRRTAATGQPAVPKTSAHAARRSTALRHRLDDPPRNPPAERHPAEPGRRGPVRPFRDRRRRRTRRSRPDQANSSARKACAPSPTPASTSAPAWPRARRRTASAPSGPADRCRGPARRTRTATAARPALLLEAGHVPELREALSRGREAMEAVVALARLGARDPQGAATALAACFEEHLLHRVARHDETDPRPTFELLVAAALPDPGVR
ncbi:hypothetical protein LNK82_03010 [Saccharothrix sp. NEAU-S10]|nr:hypothetical protein [Saccharothrix luteola]